eukprot:2669505-Alexandrium_andersonii.AAC.1
MYAGVLVVCSCCVAVFLRVRGCALLRAGHLRGRRLRCAHLRCVLCWQRGRSGCVCARKRSRAHAAA